MIIAVPDLKNAGRWRLRCVARGRRLRMIRIAPAIATGACSFKVGGVTQDDEDDELAGILTAIREAGLNLMLDVQHGRPMVRIAGEGERHVGIGETIVEAMRGAMRKGGFTPFTSEDPTP